MGQIQILFYIKFKLLIKKVTNKKIIKIVKETTYNLSHKLIYVITNQTMIKQPTSFRAAPLTNSPHWF